MKPVKGQWFAGWGFMHFWELERASSPSHTNMVGADGEGDIAEHPGEINPDTWRYPLRSMLVSFDAQPRGVVFH